MQFPYFYEPGIDVNDRQKILSEATSRHCIQVLRMYKGDELQLTDGKGNLYTATITDDHKKNCSVVIAEHQLKTKLHPFICLAVSPVKNASRLEWIVEKATEIGVNRIAFIDSARTEKHHFKIDRLQNIAIAAMLQSQQTWLPEIHSSISFQSFIDENSGSSKYIAYCFDDDRKDFASIIQATATNSATVLIGPEGDFTKDEADAAIEKGFVPVSLGETRLRTETAGIVAATLLRNLMR